jgi:uncharacterized protein (DUF433 family)
MLVAGSGDQRGVHRARPGPPAGRPSYTIAEASRYARTSASTTRRWLKGYEYPTLRGTVQAAPVTTRPNDRLLTFHDLVEVAAIASAINAGVKLPQIRSAIDYARDRFRAERPLLLERFLTDGKSLFLHELDATNEQDLHVNASEAGQIAFSYIREVLRHLDYDQDGQPARWWPVGKDGPILVDPRVGFGQPVIASTGVRTETIVDRFLAGESFQDVANEYSISPDDVQVAIRFENRLGLVPA